MAPAIFPQPIPDIPFILSDMAPDVFSQSFVPVFASADPIEKIKHSASREAINFSLVLYTPIFVLANWVAGDPYIK